MFSFTYAFIPWMMAMTATRNATLTMMPSSVKNDRSLLARIWVRAVRMTSENCTSGERGSEGCDARVPVANKLRRSRVAQEQRIHHEAPGQDVQGRDQGA